MTVKRLISVSVLAAALLCSCIPKTPDRPTPPAPDPPVPDDPDPITMVTTPGAYGVEGGDVIFDLSVNLFKEFVRPREYVEDQILFAFKMSIESAFGYACQIGDILNIDIRKPFCLNQCGCSFVQSAFRLLCLLLSFCHFVSFRLFDYIST